MNCKSCGAMLEPGEKFCKLCGTPAPAEEPQTANSMVPPAGVTLANSESNNMGVDALVQPQPVAPQAPATGTMGVIDLMNPTPQAPVQPVQPQAPVMPQVQPQPVVAPVQPAAPMGGPVPPAPVNPMPNMQPVGAPQKKSSMGIIIVVALVAVVAVLAVVFLTKDKKTGDDPASNSNSNQPEVITPTSATTKVKFNGFVYDVSDEYKYEIKDSSLYIGDLNNTWVARVDTATASYDTLKAQRASIKTNLARYGYTVSNPDVKQYGGLEYITLEAKNASGSVAIYAYAKANNTTVYGIVAINNANTADYNNLTNLSKILKTGKYEGGSNYITNNKNQSATVGIVGIK